MDKKETPTNSTPIIYNGMLSWTQSEDFMAELSKLYNKFSIDSKLNTHDFLLAEMTYNFLATIHNTNSKENLLKTKDIIDYADKYSHKIWKQLINNFDNIKDFSIGANDVSDFVLNAIINAMNGMQMPTKPTTIIENQQDNNTPHA